MVKQVYRENQVNAIKAGCKFISYLIISVFVAQAADFILRRNIRSDRSDDVEISSFCSASFQNIRCNFVSFRFQLCPVLLVAHVLVLLVAVDPFIVKGLRFQYLFLQRLNIALIDYATKAGGMQIEVLPVLGNHVAAPIVAKFDCPSQLLEQLAAFLLKCRPVGIARPARGIAFRVDAKIDLPICHINFCLLFQTCLFSPCQ